MGLWPSLTELGADQRTGIGERRRIALGEGVWVEMNTQTSLAIRPTAREGDRIELIAGEAAIAASSGLAKPLMVLADAGSAIASQATFTVRRDGARVRVVCVDGVVRVKHRDRACMVQAKQQVIYDARGLGAATTVDPGIATAWQHGLLVFRNEPLGRVVEEVNRYRPGRIVVLNEALGRRPVVASFRLDRLDEVVWRIEHVFNARVTRLPAGIVLLS
jgi:transmembrane sensor